MFRELNDYKKHSPTKSCFLDGRFVPIVLEDVAEFHKQPIFISMEFDMSLELMSSNIHGSFSIREGMNIVRLVIVSPEMRHSALIWIDTRDKTIVFTDVRSSDQTDQHMIVVDRIVNELVRDFFSHLRGYTHSSDIAYIEPASRPVNQACARLGFCNAYVIKQVIDYVQDVEPDLTHIDRFAAAIEKKYSHLLDPNTEPEVEYYRGGWGHGWGGAGLGLGLVGGVALGSALAAPRYAYSPYGYGYQPMYGYPPYY